MKENRYGDQGGERKTRCPFCGDVHSRRADKDKCAKAFYAKEKREGPTPPAKERPASEFMLSVTSGHRRSQAIIRLARDGKTPRRIAKLLGVNLKEVESVLLKAKGGGGQ